MLVQVLVERFAVVTAEFQGVGRQNIELQVGCWACEVVYLQLEVLTLPADVHVRNLLCQDECQVLVLKVLYWSSSTAGELAHLLT